MRIAFLCGGLEVGRDGVGDYTRHLAAECIRRGHEAVILSLHDKGRAGMETQMCDEVPVPCLRCSATVPWAVRLRAAREFLNPYQPDWISLQFVPYGFHPKGLPLWLAADLQSLIAGRQLQIMFHELWVSPERIGSPKERLIGGLQRWMIFRMIHLLKPGMIHTSNALYVELLKKGGAEAEALPLFGNIPIIPPGSELPGQFDDVGVPVNAPERSGWWWGLFFGTIHPQWEPEPLIGILLPAAQRARKRLCLVSIGRTGAAGEAIWEAMRREYGSEITFVKCGAQPEERISTLLQCADMGIATSPWSLIGKSGTAVAMLEHGLPVICARDDGGMASAPSFDPLLYRCDAALEERLAQGLPKRTPASRVGEICAGFLTALT